MIKILRLAFQHETRVRCLLSRKGLRNLSTSKPGDQLQQVTGKPTIRTNSLRKNNWAILLTTIEVLLIWTTMVKVPAKVILINIIWKVRNSDNFWILRWLGNLKLWMQKCWTDYNKQKNTTLTKTTKSSKNNTTATP